MVAVPAWATDLFTLEFLSRAAVTRKDDKPVWSDPESASPAAAEWDRHWLRLQHGLAGRMFSLYRRQVRSRCVASYLAKHFPTGGVFAECGCGSGETSCRLGTERTVIAVDFSEVALRKALRFPCYAGGVLADIRRLPFGDESLDGVWNLGVLEHFEFEDQLRVLREFRRILKPNGRLLVWWPPPFGLDHRLLGRLRSFPPEPGRADRQTAQSRLEEAGFQRVQVEFPLSDCFTELVVTGSKG